METLYLLGAQDRIVGVSGYCVRPSAVRRDKPRVSAFTSADMPKILALKPDMVLTFSDLQAEIVADLVRAGIAVHAFNRRSIAGILDMVRLLGVMVGAGPAAQVLVDALVRRIDAARAAAARLHHRPRVYFEEWDAPMISGVAWISELIEAAGGTDVFSHLAGNGAARDRIVTAEQVVAAAPEIIVASWCGKKFRPERLAARPSFDTIPAVRNRRLHEIKASIILQPGPAALTDGVAALQALFCRGDMA